MIARLLAASVLVPLVLAGCSSSSGPSKKGSDADALATKLHTALNSLTSAHLDINAGTLGGKSTADIALSGGKATATDIHLASSNTEVLIAGGTTYVKVPGGTSGKPWATAQSLGSNTAVQNSLEITGVTSSLSAVPNLVKSSKSLQDKGKATVDGVSTEYYTFKLDPTKNTGSSQLNSLLGALGSTPVPVDLWLDDKDRPVKFTINIALGNTKLPITVDVSKYDAPLTITAPPASQVSG